jgi:hypothetical protein
VGKEKTNQFLGPKSQQTLQRRNQEEPSPKLVVQLAIKNSNFVQFPSFSFYGQFSSSFFLEQGSPMFLEHVIFCQGKGTP